MLLHFLRIIAFVAAIFVSFSKKTKNKIGIISAISIGVAVISANIVWFEYRRILLPIIGVFLGRIPYNAIELFINAVGTALTFVISAFLLRLLGKTIYGSYDKNTYCVAIERLRGALPLFFKKALFVASNFVLISRSKIWSLVAKRPTAVIHPYGSAMVFTFNRILI